MYIVFQLPRINALRTKISFLISLYFYLILKFHHINTNRITVDFSIRVLINSDFITSHA
jgi:hypothetical protein